MLMAQAFRRRINKNVTYPIQYKKGDIVEHIATEGRYVIEILPDEAVLEYSREPAYGYRLKDGRLCFRCQEQMEDGRFKIITPRQYRDN